MILYHKSIYYIYIFKLKNRIKIEKQKNIMIILNTNLKKIRDL